MFPFLEFVVGETNLSEGFTSDKSAVMLCKSISAPSIETENLAGTNFPGSIFEITLLFLSVSFAVSFLIAGGVLSTVNVLHTSDEDFSNLSFAFAQTVISPVSA